MNTDAQPPMNTPANKTVKHADILTPYLDALGRNGIQATPIHKRARAGQDVPEAWLRLAGPWGKADWACELKNRLERGTAGPVIHRIKQIQTRVDRVLLLTEHVTPPMAEDLREQGIAFVDAAGNAFLEDKGLYVWVTNRPPKTNLKGERRGLHAAGLRLLYVLLRQRRHARNLRELAGEAGIALGGVTRILHELERRAWIRRLHDGVELQDPVAMLKRWEDGYADTLRPKLFLKTCRRKPGTGLDQLPKRIGVAGLCDKVRIGGELGAALLTRNLRPETATLHLDGIDAIEAMRGLDLVPDPDGDVHLVKAFGQVNAGTAKKPDGAVLADPLLIHAELLLRADDRLREIAETVRAEHIATRWT